MDLQSFQTLALPSLILEASRKRGYTSKTEMTAKECNREDKTDPVTSSYHTADVCRGDVQVGTGKGTMPVSKRLMVIDEVGKMELLSKDFVDRVWQLFDDRTPGVDVVMLVTIPVSRPHQKQHWLLQNIRLRQDCKLFEVWT